MGGGWEIVWSCQMSITEVLSTMINDVFLTDGVCENDFCGWRLGVFEGLKVFQGATLLIQDE